MAETVDNTQTIEALTRIFGPIGAHFEYEEFLSMFNNPNNRNLENSTVMMALRKLLLVY